MVEQIGEEGFCFDCGAPYEFCGCYLEIVYSDEEVERTPVRKKKDLKNMDDGG